MLRMVRGVRMVRALRPRMRPCLAWYQRPWWVRAPPLAMRLRRLWRGTPASMSLRVLCRMRRLRMVRLLVNVCVHILL